MFKKPKIYFYGRSFFEKNVVKKIVVYFSTSFSLNFLFFFFVLFNYLSLFRKPFNWAHHNHKQRSKNRSFSKFQKTKLNGKRIFYDGKEPMKNVTKALVICLL
jgi:hypothetical protein